jgi:hypothetical protein
MSDEQQKEDKTPEKPVEQTPATLEVPAPEKKDVVKMNESPRRDDETVTMD